MRQNEHAERRDDEAADTDAGKAQVKTDILQSHGIKRDTDEDKRQRRGQIAHVLRSIHKEFRQRNVAYQNNQRSEKAQNRRREYAFQRSQCEHVSVGKRRRVGLNAGIAQRPEESRVGKEVQQRIRNGFFAEQCHRDGQTDENRIRCSEAGLKNAAAAFRRHETGCDTA